MICPHDVSVVLVSYARPWNLPIICQSLVDYGFEDIHMVDNWQPSWESDGIRCRTDSSMLHTQFSPELLSKVKYIKARSNCKTASRYLSLDKHVKHEVIATVDDDYVVTDKGWDHILEAWTGEKIVAQLPAENGQFRQSGKVPFINIGYGSLFKKSWANVVFSYLLNEGLVSQEEFRRFGDRIFTTFFGSWDIVEATDKTLRRLTNPNGELSDTDSSSIHLKSDYWLDQWNLVMKVMGHRLKAKDLYMKESPSFYEYQNLMEFLSHTAYGDLATESG
tara:strand:+ start:6222 stop:7052 length:831 start_codon:yes stop_codon:yes gene_type:complete